MVDMIQPSFAKGEISPSLYGRVDTAMYQVALRTAYNAVVHAAGGISNRPGLAYVGPVLDHTRAPYLIPFEFRTEDTYLLEFGNLYMRVIRNDGHVLNAAKTILDITNADPAVVEVTAHGYTDGLEVFIDGVGGMTEVNGRRFIVKNPTTDTFELHWQDDSNETLDATGYGVYTTGGTVASVYTIPTPYAQADLEELKYVQDADVVTLTRRGHPVRKLSRLDHDDWTLTEAEFEPTIAFPTDVAVTADTTGAVTAIYAVTAISTEQEESLTGQSDVVRTITGITNANPPVVTSSVDHEFVSGDEVLLDGIVGLTALNGRRFTIFDASAGTFKLLDEDTTDEPAYVSGGTAAQTLFRITDGATVADNTISWSAVAGAAKYAIYKRSGGLWGLLGETIELTFKDANLAPDLSLSPPLSRNPFRTVDDYPGTATYFEQRQVFGGSYNRPDTSWYSKIGQPYNMTVSVPAKADDAITASLNSRKVNEIRHFVPGNDLIVFTSGSEWRVNSGQDSAFEAATIKQKPQSEYGSSHLPPIKIGSTILFVPPTKASVRSFGYSIQIDGYTGADLTLLADHLLEANQIVSWAYSRSPDPIVYSVRTDGMALALTYEKDQEVVAWTRWKTKGRFERVCTLRAAPDERDEVAYFVVRRRVRGRWVRYIERTRPRRLTDIRDSFFVDSGLSYDEPFQIEDVSATNPVQITADGHGYSNGDLVDVSGIVFDTVRDETGLETTARQINDRRFTVAGATTEAFELSGGGSNGEGNLAYLEGGLLRRPVSTVGGLWHLEGEEVIVLADGNVVSGLVVENGQITLPRACSRIHVGLPYTFEIETLNIEAPQGNIQARQKKISSVKVRLKYSRGLFAGVPGGIMDEMQQRQDELLGDPTNPLTGDKEIVLSPEWTDNGRMIFRQPWPLPVTILAVMPDVEVGD